MTDQTAPPSTYPEPLRVLRAGHRAAREHAQARRPGPAAAARTEVAQQAALVDAYALADGLDLADPTIRDAAAWLLLAIGGAEDRDSALAILVHLIAEGLDAREGA